ncbi:hypothetical protein [Saccharopolyspora thermophila]|uniref:Aminoglycoside phosphotransferase domain-containing protein n=1 Tax=Saccharopolyspora thermophila TaxID=89367 RepID=A0ABN1CF28_9PSEU
MHTDLHVDQFLISNDHCVRVIDWGWPSAGAAWVDTALLVIRLILAGHTPAEAEAWAHTVPSFSTTSRDHLAALTSYVAGLWTYRAASGQIPHSHRRARIARDYAAHCVTDASRHHIHV